MKTNENTINHLVNELCRRANLCEGRNPHTSPDSIAPNYFELINKDKAKALRDLANLFRDAATKLSSGKWNVQESGVNRDFDFCGDAILFCLKGIANYETPWASIDETGCGEIEITIYAKDANGGREHAIVTQIAD